MANLPQLPPNPPGLSRRGDEYCLVEIIYIDNSTATFMLNAGIGLAKYLQTELEQRGSVLLRNNTDAMVIVKDQLRSLTMRTVTN